MENSFAVDDEDAGKRLDVYLAEQVEELTRSYIQKLISEMMATVNSQPARANCRLKTGDLVRLQVPDLEALEVIAEPIALDIYYEDADVVVVNKPRGMVVHPAEGNYSGTLVNALLYHCRDLSGINGVMRPGIVHRLDKDTSGLIVAAKNDAAHASLAQQFKDRQVNRFYRALVHGRVKEKSGEVDAPIGRDPRDRQRMAVVQKNGKQAVTTYRVLGRYNGYTYLDLKLRTGRTHQIRVHMSYIGYPVVGDPKYGPTRAHFNLDGQFLHAELLGFSHPRSGQHLEFKAPLPEVLQNVLKHLTPEEACEPGE
ncbi:MAG: RluA family pseudouridine synthase [Desulfotomaculaceae bacterium]|nr:RluA family pseudouridine synthase [Desulfotomaculaceae bacterium]